MEAAHYKEGGTCPKYSKASKCKHSIYVGYKTKKIKQPDHSKDMDRKAKKGRPKKTTKPLEKQPGEQRSPEV